jgi:polyhydroxyalkanoate synthesis regulator phasin
MSKYGDAVTALVRGGVKNADDARKIVDEIGEKSVLKAIYATGGTIDRKLLTKIDNILSDPDTIAKIVTRNEQIFERVLRNAIKNGRIDDAIVNGKLVKGNYSLEELARMSGKSVDELTEMAARSDVQDAAKTSKKDLIKLGISGSLVAGIIFIMLATGKNNPVEAIAEALKAAAKTTAGAGADIFQNLFKGGLGGLFNVSALFLFCSSLLLILYLVGSVVLKS